MRCPSCETLMLKEYCDGGYVWRCMLCVQMHPLYDPRKAQTDYQRLQHDQDMRNQR